MDIEKFNAEVRKNIDKNYIKHNTKLNWEKQKWDAREKVVKKENKTSE